MLTIQILKLKGSLEVKSMDKITNNLEICMKKDSILSGLTISKT